MKKKNNNTMEENLNASIIGFWRNGMTHDEIASATGLTPFVVDNIIWNYLNSKK